MPNPYDKLYQKYGLNDAYSASNDANNDEEERKRRERMANGGKATDPYAKMYEKYQIKDDGSFISEEKKQEVETGRNNYKVSMEADRVKKEEQARQDEMNFVDKIVESPTTQKAANFIGNVTKKVSSWWDEAAFKMNEQSLFNPGREQSMSVGENGNLVVSYPRVDAYKAAKTKEEKEGIMQEAVDATAEKTPLIKFLNSESGQVITGEVARKTSDVPLKMWATLKAIGDDTYDEAYASLMAGKNDPNNGRFARIMYGIQDGGVQSAVGALLAVGTSIISRNPNVGRAVSMAYFGAVSAESQRIEKGKVSSMGNIAIDTAGDMVLSGIAESAFKNVIKEGGEATVKEFLKQSGKGFVTEGGTEVSQSFLKMANDYKNEKTEEGKKQVVDQLVNYVKSGGMTDEFLIGGFSGAAVQAGAVGVGAAANKITGKKTDVNVEPSLQPKKDLTGAEKPKEEPTLSGELDDDYNKLRDEVATLQSKIGDNIDDDVQMERMSALQDQLNDFHQAFKQRPIYITDNIQDAPLAEVETVQYPDGKFSFRFSADTETMATGAPFSTETFASKEQAVSAATAQIKEWANSSLKTAEGKDVPQLNAILEQVDAAAKPEVIKPAKENQEIVSEEGLAALETELKALNAQKADISNRGASETDEVKLTDIDKEYTAITAKIAQVEMQISQGPLKKEEAKMGSVEEKAQEKKLNLQDKDDRAYLVNVFGEDRVKEFESGNFTDWRGHGKDYFESQVRSKIVSEKPQTAKEKLEGKVREYKLRSNKLYHGTSAENTEIIQEKGFKNGSELPKDAFRSGGYGAMQKSISFSTDPEIASNFTGSASQGVIFETTIAEGAKVVQIKGITHAEELNEFIAELKRQKVDAVYIADEKEVVVINKKVLGKIDNATQFDVTQAKKDLADVYTKAKKTNFLFEDAKKYKSAEEFIASKQKLFHGTGESFESFDEGSRGKVTKAKSAVNASWFTDSEEVAKAYSIYAAEEGPVVAALAEAEKAEKVAQRSGLDSDWKKYDEFIAKSEELAAYDATFERRKLANIKEAFVDGEFLEVDAEGKTPQELSDEGDIDSWLQAQLDEAKAQGKDGVIFNNLDDAVGLYDRPATHYAIFEAKNIKTEKQLRDIYEQSINEDKAFDIDALDDAKIETFLSTKEAMALVEKIKKETNPNIAATLQYQLFEKIVVENGAEQGLGQRGWFNGKDTIGMARNMSRKQFEATLRHETRHSAFSLMGSEDQQKVIAWYKTLSEADLLNLFGEKVLKHYRSNYAGKELDKKMADEAANWMMDKKGVDSSPVHSIYRKVIEAIAKLLNKLNSKIFAKAAQEFEVQALYKDVFSQNGGSQFARSKGYLAELEAKGFNAGTITNGDTGFSQRGISQSVEEKEAEKETSTNRFKKIVDKRAGLLKTKNKLEKDFAASEKGTEVAQKVAFQTQMAEDANTRVIQAIKNNTTFKKEGSISEEMGSGFLMTKNERAVVVESKNVKRYLERGYERGIEIDSLAAEGGFENGVAYLEHELAKKTPYSVENEQRKALARSNSFYGKVLEELEKTETELKEAKDSKGAFYLGMRIGSQTIKEKLSVKLKEFSSRKKKARAIKDFFALSDSQFKKIGGNRDLQYMSEDEFQGFLKHIGQQSENEVLRSQALELVMAQIKEKELKKYDNLRRAMALPTIDQMTTEQLREFDLALEDSQLGDEFFTQRQLETVKNTELKGIKTVREAREKLAERIDMPLGELDNIKVSPTLDAMRYDTAFAEANPFYRLIVEETNIATLEAEARFLMIEHEANKLIKKARKSRKRSLADRIAPKDELIFSYLEASDKTEIAAEMTNQELEAAEFIRRSYEQMRDYLIANNMMEKYREDYITHIRRGFLETWRGDGMVTAIKEIFVQQQEDAAVFRILQSDTKEILPLEKFFQFTLKRTGGLIPTQNVAAAFLAYTKSFEKKRALDSLIPKLDIYVYAISPKEMTERGLFMDRSLKKIYNEWMNNKKGRKTDLGGKLPQGGTVDTVIRAFIGLTSIIDLGLSVPAGVITNIGEQSQNMKMLGPKQYALGAARLLTGRGRKIVKNYQNFVGKNPWAELAEASNTLGDTFLKTTFILFKDANIRGNKIFLLGSMTKAEFRAGEIETERLSNMKIDMGRFRAVEGAKSILGATSIGSAVNQYKGWAIPILRTTIKDAKTLTKNIKKDGISALYSREGWELFYTVAVEGGLGLLLLSVLSSGKDTEKEKTFTEKIIDKGIRDVMSGVGAMDPKFFISVPRVLAFLTTISNASSQIIHKEQYTQDAPDGSYEEGDLKGVKNLKKSVTPSAIKQFLPANTTDADKRADLVKEQVKAGKDPYAIADDVAKQLGYDQNADDYNSKWGKIKNDAMREEVVQKTGKQTERLMKARLNTAKMKILKEYKADMTSAEFKTYLETLYDGKVISKAVYDEF